MESLRLPDCSALIATALDEDFAYGPDYTSLATVPGEARCTAEFTAREAGTIAGLGLIEEVLEATAQRLAQWGVDTAGSALADAPAPTITLHSTDGDRVAPGQVIATVQAPTLLVLAAERTMLNMVSHVSGIATQTRRRVGHQRRRVADGITPRWRVADRRLGEVQADIQHAHRVGEGADGDIVHARGAVLTGVLQLQSAGDLQRRGWA